MYKIKFPLNIVGAQWGDEGKGKLVDVISEKADYVVRYNGGNNAGHTVIVGKNVFKLSLLPSGAAQKKKLVIAQGCVIDPKVLLDEIEMVKKSGLPVSLYIDPRVHLVMPYHKMLDRATEIWKGKNATGSLHLGIGYCYEDKNNRFGVRLDDLFHPEEFEKKLKLMTEVHLARIKGVFGQTEKIDVQEIFKTYLDYGKRLKKYMTDVSSLMTKEIAHKNILFEGAHGTLLDAVFGTYPYTVAINTISGSVFPYVGIAPQKLDTLGIVKAYATRVGNGPFATELFDEKGEHLRTKGGEFGTVSKRPRRCGWLDLAAVRTSARLSGFTSIALTKLDVLSGLEEIKISTSYKIGKLIYNEIPSSSYDYYRVKPVYKIFKGWSDDLSEVRNFKMLPENAKIYIKYIANNLKIPVSYVSVGPERDQILKIR